MVFGRGRTRKSTLVPGLALCCAVVSTADVGYRSRGDRAEGVKPDAYAGDDIQLVSAQVDYHEPTPALPRELKIRFYLPSAAPVYVTVRELEYRTAYWLDTVSPPRPWQAGFGNVFGWPTGDVVRPLGVGMYDLGVVARLRQPRPAPIEHVAPVIYFHTRPPPVVSGYLFAFRTAHKARVTAKVTRDADRTTVHEESLESIAGTAVFVRWKAAGASAGAYTLVVDAILAGGDNTPVKQTVRFTHQPIVPAAAATP